MPWLTPGSNGAGGQLLLIRVDEWRQPFSKRHPRRLQQAPAFALLSAPPSSGLIPQI
jgi:hypothetical protein